MSALRERTEIRSANYTCPDEVFSAVNRMKTLVGERGQDDILRALRLCMDSPGNSSEDRQFLMRTLSRLQPAWSEDGEHLSKWNNVTTSNAVGARPRRGLYMVCTEAEAAARLLQHGATFMRYLHQFCEERPLPFPTWLCQSGEICSRESHHTLPRQRNGVETQCVSAEPNVLSIEPEKKNGREKLKVCMSAQHLQAFWFKDAAGFVSSLH